MMRTMAALVLVLLTWRTVEAEEARRDLYGDPLPKGARMRLGTVRFRHGGYAVIGVAYSPAGEVLATCGGDDLIRLWDARTGKELRRLTGHTKTPTNLAFSPDGKTLASGSEDSEVRLWDVATGKLLRTVKEEGASFSIVFTHDGKCLASGSADKRIRLRDVATGKCLRTLEGHNNGDVLLSMSPDGKLLASGGWDDGMICLWDMTTGKMVRECGRRVDKVHQLQFAPDGKTLASCGEEGSIHLWDVATGKEVQRWKAHEGEVFTLIFSANGRTLFSGDDDGNIREWDAATGKERRTLGRVPLFINGLSLSPDGRTLASVSWRHVVRRWDLAVGKELTSPRGHEGLIHFVRFADDGATLLSTAEDGSARFWDVATGKEIRSVRASPDREGPAKAALSADGRFFAAASNETIQVRNLTSGKRLASFKVTRNIDGLRFSRDSKVLAVGADNEVRLWDVSTGKERCRVSGQWCVAFSADSRLLATPDAISSDKPEGGIHLWETVGGKEVRYISRPDKNSALYPLCFSSDGRMLAGWQHHRRDKKASERGILVVWEAATGRELFRLHTHGDVIYAVAFSADGTMMAAGGEEQTVHLWDVPTGREQPSLRGDQGEIRSLAFSKDGRRLASGGQNTTILLWPIAASPRTQTAPNKDLSPSELQALWGDLGVLDAARAFRSMRTLYTHPPSTVAFLCQQLRPAEAVDAETARRLLVELESDDFAIRERATKELVKLGDAAEQMLRRALRQKPSLELRRRAERLLNELATETPERLRTRRAVEVLEWLDTAESRRLLEELAGGAADVWLTREGKAARQRRAAR